MKNFKKLWKKELNNILPSLREDVKNTPIVCENEKEPERTNFNSNKKFGFKTILASGVLAVLLVSILLPSVFSFYKKEEKLSLVMLEVNPSVVFSLNEKNKVVNVVSTNFDADVVLSDKEKLKNLKGVSIEDASKNFVDYSAELGFINYNEQGDVKITACKEQEDSGVLNSIKEEMKNFFKEKGAYIAVNDKYVGKEDISKKLGYKESISFNNLAKKVRNLETNYAVRKNVWRTNYKNIVNLEEKFKKIEEGFKNYFESIKQSLIDKLNNLYEINRLSEEIINHKSNPSGLFIRTYWQIKNKNLVVEDSEFNNLMLDMEIELLKFKKKYGEEFSSKLDLNLEIENLSLLNLLLTDAMALTISVVCQNIKIVAPILKEINEEEFKDIELFKEPITIEEFSGQLINFRAGLKEKFSEEYSKHREAISNEDYQNFINSYKF